MSSKKTSSVLSAGNEARMRVLYLVDKMIRAGAQTHLAQLLRGMPGQGVETHLACLLEAGPWGEELSGEGIPVHSLGLQGVIGLDFFRALGRLRKLCRQTKPDLIHAYLFSANLVAPWAGRAAGIRVVTSRRDDGWWKTRKHVLALRAGNFLAERITANSRAVEAYLRGRERVRPEKIALIPNGVEIPRETPGRTTGPIRRLGCLGNLRPVKGYDVFLHALSRLPDKDWEAEIVGEEAQPGYRRQLEQLRDDLGLRDRVRFRGGSSSPGDFLDSLDLFILPSLSEGFSNSLLEAMARGVPVLATRAGANPEVIRNGREGLLVEPGEAKALASALDSARQDPVGLKKMGEAGRRRVEKEYGEERMLERMKNLYRNVLGAEW